MIIKVFEGCDAFQRNKITGSKNYGKVPPTDDKDDLFKKTTKTLIIYTMKDTT